MDASNPRPFHERVRFGVFELDLQSGELRRDGAKIKLQEQPLKILQVLVDNPGQVITHEELRKRIWPEDTFVAFDHGLYSAITKLREALGDSSNNARFIQTLPRRGYRFIAPVERAADSVKTSTDEVDLPPNVLRNIEPARGLPSWVRGTRAWAIFSLGALLAFGAAWVGLRATPSLQPLVRLSVDLGPNTTPGLNTTVAISRDGTRIVFPIRGVDGKQRLATRLLDQEEASVLPGTENASDPFFSPDGQWVGFFAASQLRKVPVQGGVPVTLSAAPTGIGASWADDGSIIAALTLLGGLSRVPDGGGAPQSLTKPTDQEGTHRWPQVLPGSKAVLFTAMAGASGLDAASIEVVELATGKRKTLQRSAYFGRYLPSGHLVYIHGNVLFGVAFDAARLELAGTPVPLLEDVAGNATRGGGQFDFSNTGTLVYLAGKAESQRWPVVWLERSGRTQALVAEPGVYDMPRFSPDGERLALVSSGDVVVYDLRQDTMTRLTFSGRALAPIWTPDGKHIVFQSVSKSGVSLVWIRADGAGETVRLLENHSNPIPYSFSPDGHRLAYLDLGPETGYDLWTLPLDLTGDPERPNARPAEIFLRTPFNETVPSFSPDGRWIAYRSNESGANEIYVRAFPGTGGAWQRQISNGGGLYAIWSNNGRELFYETLDHRIMVMDYVASAATFGVGKPRLWSDRELYYTGLTNLALTPDGRRFAVFPRPEAMGGESGAVRVTFLLNFFDELRRRLPASPHR